MRLELFLLFISYALAQFAYLTTITEGLEKAIGWFNSKFEKIVSNSNEIRGNAKPKTENVNPVQIGGKELWTPEEKDFFDPPIEEPPASPEAQAPHPSGLPSYYFEVPRLTDVRGEQGVAETIPDFIPSPRAEKYRSVFDAIKSDIATMGAAVFWATYIPLRIIYGGVKKALVIAYTVAAVALYLGVFLLVVGYKVAKMGVKALGK